MGASTPATSRSTLGVRGLPRIAIVAGAVVAALVVYGVASIFMTVRTPGVGGQAAQNLEAVFVILGSAVPALLGWGLLVLLERFRPNGQVIWRVSAVVVLLLSLVAPFSGTGITTANRIWLAAMHIAVGAVLIALLPAAGRKR